ncbi:hypothetical protein KQ941_06375 [Paenibacillus xylanexedens]|nr:hypothetical protein [Paenibacillus xylanexedens]
MLTLQFVELEADGIVKREIDNRKEFQT